MESCGRTGMASTSLACPQVSLSISEKH